MATIEQVHHELLRLCQNVRAATEPELKEALTSMGAAGFPDSLTREELDGVLKAYVWLNKMLEA